MLCFRCVLYLEYRATVSRLYMPLGFVAHFFSQLNTCLAATSSFAPIVGCSPAPAAGSGSWKAQMRLDSLQGQPISPRTATRTVASYPYTVRYEGGDAVTCRDLYENRKSLLTAMTCEKNSGLWSALEWLGTSSMDKTRYSINCC